MYFDGGVLDAQRVAAATAHSVRKLKPAAQHLGRDRDLQRFIRVWGFGRRQRHPLATARLPSVHRAFLVAMALITPVALQLRRSGSGRLDGMPQLRLIARLIGIHAGEGSADVTVDVDFGDLSLEPWRYVQILLRHHAVAHREARCNRAHLPLGVCAVIHLPLDRSADLEGALVTRAHRLVAQ
eukprot:scaffold36490_cov61-Phaeocystis_antarctica.AAC.1